LLKREIRECFIAALSPEVLSGIIFEKALEIEEVKKASSLFLYFPLKSNHEVDLRKLASSGKRIALPMLDGKSDFHFSLFQGELERGPWKIPHPLKDIPVEPDENTVVFIPGVSFDRKGNRVGLGYNYYENYLKAYPNAFTIGVICSGLLVDSIDDISPDEVPVKALLTDREYIRF